MATNWLTGWYVYFYAYFDANNRRFAVQLWQRHSMCDSGLGFSLLMFGHDRIFKIKECVWKDFFGPWGHETYWPHKRLIEFQSFKSQARKKKVYIFHARTALSCQQTTREPPFLHTLSACERWARVCVYVCVYVCVCAWATLSLWFTAPLTLSPSVCWSTAMVKAATMAGYGPP